MDHIFISHSHEDSDFAENLHNKLTQAGFNIWRDTAIRGGEDWRREIDGAIKEAIALLVIMTPAAKASQYVHMSGHLHGVPELKLFRSCSKLRNSIHG